MEYSSIESVVLDEKGAAKYIGMSVSFLRQSRMKVKPQGLAEGPPYIKVGRAIRYRIKDLDDWLMDNRIAA